MAVCIKEIYAGCSPRIPDSVVPDTLALVAEPVELDNMTMTEGKLDMNKRKEQIWRFENC